MGDAKNGSVDSKKINAQNHVENAKSVRGFLIQFCERPMHKCLPKLCEGKKACEVEDVVNGEPKIDKCGCPLFKNKPCDNDPVHVCKKDEFRVVAGEDACECATKIKVPCAQQKPPSCN